MLTDEITRVVWHNRFLALNAYEEGHTVCWKEVEVLHIGPQPTYSKRLESAHMSLIGHPVSQCSLNIS
jgi:hypothetical protein